MPGPTPTRLLLVANPISGGGRGRRTAELLAAALTARGVAAEVHLTTGAGDGARRAALAAGEGFDGIVALGGDGTVNEVLNGLPDPGTPLGVVPVGTANVLAKELSLPAAPEAAADVLAAGHLEELAIGVCNGRRFLLFVGLGMDGAIVKRLSQVRTGTLGKHKWLGPILHTAWHWPRPELTVTVDGGRTLTGVRSVLISRVQNYGGVMTLPGVRRDSGLLHVLAFHMSSRAAWLWHGLRATVGRLRPGKHLTVLDAEAVRVEGAAPYQIDGDYGGEGPIDVSLLPVRARVFAPRSN